MKSVDLPLDVLVARVQQALQQQGIDERTADGRVAPLPDARTVRYYTTLGLLDRPAIVEREARYGERHVLQLTAIKRLQVDGHRLAEVQRQLYGASDAELRALIATAPARRAKPIEPVVWRELMIAPGLKLSAEAGWMLQGDPEEVMTRLRAALEQLSERRSQKGRQE